MARYKHWNQLRKGDDEEYSIVNSGYFNRTRPNLLSLLFLFLFSCTLLIAPHHHIFCSNSSHFYYSSGLENEEVVAVMNLCSSSSIHNGSMCCDRSGTRSDICVMKGDIRTHSASSSIILYSATTNTQENIKPYTRKWETSVMDTIDELHLTSTKHNNHNHHCDVNHHVPAVFFSTGGYTGNVYHEFNDGILPLYITAQHLKKEVVFVILEYHDWWITKYADILSHLSHYPAIDFSQDNRTHCFPQAIVGLNIHDELSVVPSLMQENKSIAEFRKLLDQAYWPRIRALIQDEADQNKVQERQNFSLSNLKKKKKPKMVILSRNGSSRSIINEDLMVKMAEKIGFEVEVLRPDRTTELAKIYRALNSSEVMVGVHGAAMTHFLFMRPNNSVFIQVIPLGTEWAAETYYGEPARKLGLKYIGYKILPRESSLYDKYEKNDPILQDPMSVAQKGWQYTKTIYLDTQNVRLNLKRFQKRLLRAYNFSITKMNHYGN